MNQATKPFHFKKFTLEQDRCLMKVGTDSVLLGAWADIQSASKVLYIGTGTGILALMVAQRNALVKIHAVEIDEQSALQSMENCKMSEWADRITVYHKSIQEFCKIRLDQYDHIISNPPFFVNSTLSTDKTRNTARHALDLTHTELLRSSDVLLKKEGFLSLILPLHEGREFIGEAIGFGFKTPDTGELGTVDGILVDRAFIADRRNTAQEIVTVDRLSELGFASPHCF